MPHLGVDLHRPARSLDASEKPDRSIVTPLQYWHVGIPPRCRLCKLTSNTRLIPFFERPPVDFGDENNFALVETPRTMLGCGRRIAPPRGRMSITTLQILEVL